MHKTVALNYLKCLLRFGPGFTCWAIWESWAACSVVPCTAAVCEGVTELLLLLLCTSSIISCEKSNQLNSLQDKRDLETGARLPRMFHRVSGPPALSLIGTVLISFVSMPPPRPSGFRVVRPVGTRVLWARQRPRLCRLLALAQSYATPEFTVDKSPASPGFQQKQATSRDGEQKTQTKHFY